MIGRQTQILEQPVRATEIPAEWRGQYVVVADAEVNQRGDLLSGDILAISRTYHGALRAVRHLGAISRRLGLRRVPM